MKQKCFAVIMCAMVWAASSHGQTFEEADNIGYAQEGMTQTGRSTFWNDWFFQMGLDMSLQNPYGYNFAHVFPNGKTFGLDLAVGKWFTPQIGLRGKLNWENALPLLKNGHANWVAPFYQPGVNWDKGGYVALYGDVLLNMHNFIGDYKAGRTWNLSLYPRIGVNYNFGVSKGALLAGAGILNTYRLNSRWQLYADVAYMMTGSGFVGSEKVEGTGTGSNSNGYFSIGVGAQVALGKQEADERKGQISSFWDDWFLQAGLDMSLMNPYGCNFSKVFPKGKTYGLNAAIGKQFTPELALRARVQWENGLIENKHVEWVPPVSDPRSNYEEHGLVVMSLDAVLNLTNIIGGYTSEKKWHTSAFGRAGLIQQLAIGSASPLMGVGIEETYRLNDRLSLFGSLGYQVTTSESSGGLTGMQVATGSNGFFDIDLGIVVSLGRNRKM
ncbi:MAG: hypothetical protein J1E58_09715 [Prevotella sp.]|nr:hypothetical protein [Prevotella sp.]